MTLEQEMQKNETVLIEDTPHIEGETVSNLEKTSGFNFLEFILSPQLEEDESKYLNHPVNFNKSGGLAQALRGIDGLVGNTKLAVMDVVIGIVRFLKERKKKPASDGARAYA